MRQTYILTALLLMMLTTGPLMAQPAALTPDEKLALAIMKEDVKQVRALLSQDPSLLNKVDEKGKSTPLMIAMQRRVGEPTLDAIFSSTFDVNQKTQLGTPLQIAVGANYRPGVRRLLKAGADADAFAGPEPPLHTAISLLYSAPQDTLEMVNLLIGGGADVNLRNKRGEPPLVLAFGAAVQNDKVAASVVSSLLKAGADRNPTMDIKGQKVKLQQIAAQVKVPMPETRRVLGY